MTPPSRICAGRSSSTTRCPMTSPGAGCSRPAMRSGALLLEQGRIEEAEAVYRSDLGLDGKLSRACQHPDNLWSLHGLHECLTRRGEKVEAASDQAEAGLGGGARGDPHQGIVLLPSDGDGGRVADPLDRVRDSAGRPRTDVRCWVRNGNGLLAQSLTASDPFCRARLFASSHSALPSLALAPTRWA